MRCAICNRQLKNPLSIIKGIGPDCESRMIDKGLKKQQLSFNFEKEENHEKQITH